MHSGMTGSRLNAAGRPDKPVAPRISTPIPGGVARNDLRTLRDGPATLVIAIPREL